MEYFAGLDSSSLNTFSETWQRQVSESPGLWRPKPCLLTRKAPIHNSPQQPPLNSTKYLTTHKIRLFFNLKGMDALTPSIPLNNILVQTVINPF